MIIPHDGDRALAFYNERQQTLPTADPEQHCSLDPKHMHDFQPELHMEFPWERDDFVSQVLDHR